MALDRSFFMHFTTATKVLLVVMLNSMSSFVNAQNTKLLPSRSELTEREVMYYRYLEFASSFNYCEDTSESKKFDL